MTSIRTVSIGRSASCDVIVEHPSVSRLHAELTFSRKQRLYLIDCDSLSGTNVLRDNEWVAIRQEYIAESDQIRFGDIEMTVSSLIAAANRANNKTVSSGTQAVFNKPKRNPSTGQVEEG